MRQRPSFSPVRAKARGDETDQPVTRGPLRLTVEWYGDQPSHRDHQEQTPVHHYSITWSARASSEGGIVRPRALAVLRLITSSRIVGCSIGRSAGSAPLRILST